MFFQWKKISIHFAKCAVQSFTAVHLVFWSVVSRTWSLGFFCCCTGGRRPRRVRWGRIARISRRYYIGYNPTSCRERRPDIRRTRRTRAIRSTLTAFSRRPRRRTAGPPCPG